MIEYLKGNNNADIFIKKVDGFVELTIDSYTAQLTNKQVDELVKLLKYVKCHYKQECICMKRLTERDSEYGFITLKKPANLYVMQFVMEE